MIPVNGVKLIILGIVELFCLGSFVRIDIESFLLNVGLSQNMLVGLQHEYDNKNKR